MAEVDSVSSAPALRKLAWRATEAKAARWERLSGRMIVQDNSTVHPGIPAGRAKACDVLLWTTDQTLNDKDDSHDRSPRICRQKRNDPPRSVHLPAPRAGRARRPHRDPLQRRLP